MRSAPAGPRPRRSTKPEAAGRGLAMRLDLVPHWSTSQTSRTRARAWRQLDRLVILKRAAATSISSGTSSGRRRLVPIEVVRGTSASRSGCGSG